MGVFVLLGILAWWTFITVSLPPVLRGLLEEDEAIVVAATPPTAEERFQEELRNLPAPPQIHAPEVAALLQRLQNLPPIPYLLQAARQRDAATPAGQTPPPWNEAELAALALAKSTFRQAWSPFLAGPQPDWKNFPDSIVLFRFQGDFLSTDWETFANLPNLRPGGSPETDRDEDPEFTLAYLRQIRGLGSLDFGGHNTDTTRVARRIQNILETRVIGEDWPPPTLLAVRENLPPPPTLADLRAGLENDRALFLRASQYLASLPPGTSAVSGMIRWLGKKSGSSQLLHGLGDIQKAGDLAAEFSQQASELENLLQKTFLSGPAWRQWLSEDPGRGLRPLLAEGLGGFREFEDVRMNYWVAQAALEARLAWENGGLAASRRIPDPAQPGSFLKVEEGPAEVSITSVHVPAGETTPVSYRIPVPEERER